MARPKKEKSLHRGKRVYIRFTELEYDLVAGYAKDAGYPIGTFVRKQALREKLEVNYNIVADLGEIQNLTVQAAGIGNNLNQIARYFHGGGLASRGMLEELKRCIAEIRELRQEIVQLGGKILPEVAYSSFHPERETDEIHRAGISDSRWHSRNWHFYLRCVLELP